VSDIVRVRILTHEALAECEISRASDRHFPAGAAFVHYFSYDTEKSNLLQKYLFFRINKITGQIINLTVIENGVS
jgi:hypothetical protein